MKVKKVLNSILILMILGAVAGAAGYGYYHKDKLINWITGSSSEPTSTSEGDSSSEDLSSSEEIPSSEDPSSSEPEPVQLPTPLFNYADVSSESSLDLYSTFAVKPDNVSAAAYGSWTATFNFILGDGDVDADVTSNSARMKSTVGETETTYNLRLGWSSTAPINDVANFGGGYTYVSYLIFDFSLTNVGTITPTSDPTMLATAFYVRSVDMDWTLYDNATLQIGVDYQFAFVYRTNALSSSFDVAKINFDLTNEGV